MNLEDIDKALVYYEEEPLHIYIHEFREEQRRDAWRHQHQHDYHT